MSVFISVLIGLAAGVLSGFGVGGGTLLLLYLAFFTSASQQQAQGVNLIYFIACAPASLVSHIKNRYIKIKPALLASGAGVFTSVFSAVLANSVGSSLLRRFFGVLLLYAGVKELFYKKK
ncbi:MAG: TSUP family transporter [Bacillota bacterium]|nr:TSUP family transporter [Bacillota bacterium]